MQRLAFHSRSGGGSIDISMPNGTELDPLTEYELHNEFELLR